MKSFFIVLLISENDYDVTLTFRLQLNCLYIKIKPFLN